MDSGNVLNRVINRRCFESASILFGNIVLNGIDQIQGGISFMHFYKSKTVTRQIVSKALMIIMILSLVVPAVPASVKAENTVLVNEDFSSYPAGPFTIGSGNAWGKEGSAPVVQIARETVTGMTYAEIKNTSSGSSYIGQRFAAQTGGLIAEFDIRVPGNNGGSLYMMDGKINATSAAAVNTGMGAGSIQGTQSSNRIAYDSSTICN